MDCYKARKAARLSGLGLLYHLGHLTSEQVDCDGQLFYEATQVSRLVRVQGGLCDALMQTDAAATRTSLL